MIRLRKMSGSVNHSIGILQVVYSDPTEEYKGSLFRGKIRAEKTFPKEQDAIFQKIKIEVRNVINGTKSDLITIDDYGLLYYEDQEFTLAFYPPDQKKHRARQTNPACGSCSVQLTKSISKSGR